MVVNGGGNGGGTCGGVVAVMTIISPMIAMIVMISASQESASVRADLSMMI
jgi:hypothetical protein